MNDYCFQSLKYSEYKGTAVPSQKNTHERAQLHNILGVMWKKLVIWYSVVNRH